MKTQIKIEQNIPMPPRSKWAKVISEMNIGDSVVLTTNETMALRNQAKSMGMDVASRIIKPNQLRVWRTK
jgi:hypothetical protein